MKKITTIATLAATIGCSAYAGVSSTPNAAGLYEISDPIDSNVTLDSSKEYLLTNVVYVSDATITIPAGTVIRGVIGIKDSSNNVTQEPGTLAITRTGQINATGTPAAPVIFTYQSDPNPKTAPTVPLSSGQDGDELVTGLWGGVIILGNAPINNDQSADNSLLTPGTDFIEGLVEPNPSDASPDLRGVYGGDRPHDSSGVMRYVSIRNGGFNLSAANEINGLTMGGVGDGTVLEYIEVIAGQDDGFEWFGGTVNSKYLLSAYNNDDAFDYDQGFSGLGQFWAVVQADNSNDGDKGGEFDGDDQAGAKPYAIPVIYNMTVIGTGPEYKKNDDGSAKNGGGQIDYDANAGGSLFNSIIVESGIASLDLNGTCGAQVTAGNLQIRSNVWHMDVDDTAVETAADNGASTDADTALGSDNYFSNPYLGGSNYAVMGSGATSKKRYEVGGVYLKPLAYAGNDATDSTKLEPYIALYFDAVNYMGAFSPATTPWTDGWTVPSQLGYFAD
jgi:hypothetical protein